jgi:hypothetical protein
VSLDIAHELITGKLVFGVKTTVVAPPGPRERPPCWRHPISARRAAQYRWTHAFIRETVRLRLSTTRLRALDQFGAVDAAALDEEDVGLDGEVRAEEHAAKHDAGKDAGGLWPVEPGSAGEVRLALVQDERAVLDATLQVAEVATGRSRVLSDPI